MADILGTDFPPQYEPSGDEKTLALLAHVLTFVSTLLAPLIIYIIKKNESPFVAEHAKESFNFQEIRNAHNDIFMTFKVKSK